MPETAMLVGCQVGLASQEWDTQWHWIKLWWLFHAIILKCIFIGRFKPMTTMPIETLDIILSVHKRCVGVEPENIIVVARHHLSVKHNYSLTFCIFVTKFFLPVPWNNWRRPLRCGLFSEPGWPSGWTSPLCPRWCWCTCLVKAPWKYSMVRFK